MEPSSSALIKQTPESFLILCLPYKGTTEDGILQTRRRSTLESENAGVQLLGFQLPLLTGLPLLTNCVIIISQ